MLKTNQDRLVMQSVLGEIQHPTVKELPVRLDCDGVAHTLPNTGSITYNVKLGDSVYGLAGGVGIQSVRHIAEKSGGVSTVTYQDGLFCAKVMLCG